MIAILDYGLGNISAFANVYKRLNIPVAIATKVDDLKNASKVIIPGVGAFDQAMQKLNKSGMRQCLEEIVMHRHVPALGICVGMQILACTSDEGSMPGLGWIEGVVKKFNHTVSNQSLRLPHMGWNNIKATKSNALLQGIDLDARFYFLHSYYYKSEKYQDVIAISTYGEEFACAVNYRNVFGVQFHPEKSHQWGIQLLRNFARI